MKGEHDQTGVVANWRALVGRPNSAGRILDHGDTMRGAQFVHAPDVRGDTGLVHQDDRARCRRKDGCYGPGGEVLCVGFDIGKDGSGAHIADDTRGRDERKGRDDHLVTRADAVDQQGQVESRCARRHGNAILGSCDLAQRLLKLGHLGSLGQPPGLDDCGGGATFFRSQPWARDRNHSSVHATVFARFGNGRNPRAAANSAVRSAQLCCAAKACR